CHDVWVLTGACHCNLGCDGWLSGCKQCPQLGAGPMGIDLAHQLWMRKRRAYRAIDGLALVTPSRWLGDMARRSPMFVGRRVEVIPNCIDLNVFRPADKGLARQELGLPQNKKVVLFGAVNATSSSYKGYSLLVRALWELAAKSK